MAPIGEAYFPPLDRCLNGAQSLWSWELCFNILSRPDEKDNASLLRFLNDDHTRDLLVKCFSPYSPGTSETKSLFETKTSAINAASPSHAPYNIDDIREDALWLSREAKIDEVSALRLAILEYQNRAAVELSRLEETVPESTLSSSIFLSSNHGSPALPLNGSQKSSAASVKRRKRLFEILLSEKRHILKCSQYIAAGYLSADPPPETSLDRHERSTLLADIGKTLLARWGVPESKNAKPTRRQPGFLSVAIDSVRSRLENLESNVSWMSIVSEQEQEQLNLHRSVSELIEVFHVLETSLDILQRCQPDVPTETRLEWFRLMAQVSYFENVNLPDTGIGNGLDIAIQSLASLISLSLLNLEDSLLKLGVAVHLAASPDVAADLPYIYDPMAVKELNDLLINAAPLAGASLCVMAWAILSQTMRNLCLATKDARESRQEMRALDRYGGDSSDTDHERPTNRDLAALRRRSSTGSDSSQSTPLVEDIYEAIENSPTNIDGDPISHLAGAATENGKLFDVITSIAIQFCGQYQFEHGRRSDRLTRQALLRFLRACVHFVDYQPALISAIVAVITGNEEYWDCVDGSVSLQAGNPASFYLLDSELKQAIGDQAFRRFPYESWPVFQLARAVIAGDDLKGQRSAVLRNLNCFTCMLPVNYQGYQNIREDEELDFIELTENLVLDLASMTPASTQQSMLEWHNTRGVSRSAPFGFELPAGTQGKVLSDGKPLVVEWTFRFGGLSYIGKLLQYASRVRLSNQEPGSPVSSEVVAEALGVIATLVINTIQRSRASGDEASAIENTTSILDEASDELERNEDIITIVFRLFENELYKERRRGDEDDNINVLIECAKFSHALLYVMPDRVWPFLGRSGLLAISEDSGRLIVVVTTYELITGQYGFLYSCLRLYDALIEDVMSKSVSRKRPTKALTRFDEPQGFGAGISSATMEKVLSNMQRVMTDVFESFYDWKFADQDGRADIGLWLCTTFNRLLYYAFGSDTDSHSKLNQALLPAARELIESFVIGGKSDLLLQTLLRICAEGMARSSSSVPTRGDLRRTKQTTAAIDLCCNLIKAGSFMQHDMLRLQTQMFKSLGIFASLYTVATESKVSVILLLDTLIQSSFKSQSQPPSLLAHLGQQNSMRLLEILSTLDKPVNNPRLKTEIWNLLSSMLAMRQEWFAHFILTGRMPGRKASPETNGSTTQKANPMLSTALDGLSKIDQLEQDEAVAMLKFVAAAVDFWPQMLQVINDHPRFMMSISHHASSPTIKIAGRSLSDDQDLRQLRILSLIVYILAMYTHWDQLEGKNRFPEEILKHLHLLSASVAITPSYNTSLHGNLRQNFATKFPGCQIDDFRRSKLYSLVPDELSYYDTDLANKMLSFELAWNGKGRPRQGFAYELDRANLNFSIVEVQLEFLQRWSTLLLELSRTLGKHAKFQKLIADIVVDCLRANSDNKLPEPIAQRLIPIRADLAFALLETLNISKSQEPEVQAILSVAWNTLCSHDKDLGAALSHPTADYHRLLIRILYLAVQIHTFHEPPPVPEPSTSTQGNPLLNAKPIPTSSSINIALDIISTLIARGFRSLTSLLLDCPDSVTTTDFHLLTALLNACLQVPNVTKHTTTLMAAFTSSSTARCAASLLSWSDQLAPTTNGDPIYAEIAMHFLVELSIVDPIAESLAVDAVLSHILATNLMQVLQDRAFGPWDTPGRLFTIWSRGLLPLLLNLLLAVGAPIAPEVAAALNLFPAQLERASSAFSTSISTSKPPTRASNNKRPNPSEAGLLTLGLAQEAHSLALITSILQKFRIAGPSAGIQPKDLPRIEKWDGEKVREDVEGVLARRGSVRERVVPMSEKEVGWARMPGRGKKGEGGETLLEEKVVVELRSLLGVLRAGEGK